jgi:hypothetical protein
MAVDVRVLIFSEAEAIEAVRTFYQSLSQAFPAGVVRRCEIVQRDGIGLHLVIRDQNDRQRELYVSAAKLSEALIMYCLRTRIPLARRATKSLSIEAGQVALVMKLKGGYSPRLVSRGAASLAGAAA